MAENPGSLQIGIGIEKLSGHRVPHADDRKRGAWFFGHNIPCALDSADRGWMSRAGAFLNQEDLLGIGMKAGPANNLPGH